MFDKDGDGHISYAELSDVMRLLGNNPTDDDLRTIMEDLDTNRKSDYIGSWLDMNTDSTNFINDCSGLQNEPMRIRYSS